MGNGWVAQLSSRITGRKVEPAPTCMPCERYYSFREAAGGPIRAGKKWYHRGGPLPDPPSAVRWQLGGGEEQQRARLVNTSFAMLFLVRSSKSIEHAQYFKNGMLTGGRGACPPTPPGWKCVAGRLHGAGRPSPRPTPCWPNWGRERGAGRGPRRGPWQTLRPLPPRRAGDPGGRGAQGKRKTAREMAAGPTDTRGVAALAALARTRNLDYVPALDPGPGRSRCGGSVQRGLPGAEPRQTASWSRWTCPSNWPTASVRPWWRKSRKKWYGADGPDARGLAAVPGRRVPYFVEGRPPLPRRKGGNWETRLMQHMPELGPTCYAPLGGPLGGRLNRSRASGSLLPGRPGPTQMGGCSASGPAAVCQNLQRRR